MFGYWPLVLIILYAAPLIALLSPGIINACGDVWRSTGPSAALFILLALAAAFYAFPSSASKSGGGETNPPNPVVIGEPHGVINLYFQDSTGRLFPIGPNKMEFIP